MLLFPELPVCLEQDAVKSAISAKIVANFFKCLII